MGGRIVGPKFGSHLERRDGFGVAAVLKHRPAEPDECVGEPGIQLGGALEMSDRRGELLILPVEFAQYILGAGVGGINLELLLKLVLGRFLVFIRFWPGKHQAADAVMDAGQVRVSVEDLAILRNGFVPFALRLERFSVQQTNLVGGWRRDHEFLRGTDG